jgi:hypothetical protein
MEVIFLFRVSDIKLLLDFSSIFFFFKFNKDIFFRRNEKKNCILRFQNVKTKF